MPLPLLLLAVQQADILPPFPSGWYAAPGGGPTTGRVAGAAKKGFAAIGATLKTFPVEREIRLTLSVRAEDATGTATINSFAYGDGTKLLKQNSTPIALVAGKWVEGRTTMIAPRGTKRMTVFVIGTGPKPMDVKEPRVELGATVLSDVKGGGLLRASESMPVAGEKGTVVFPVPGPTAEQVPVSFALRADPPEALKGYAIRRRVDDNWVCEAEVAPPKGKTVSLRWESLVAVRDLPEAALPKAAFGATDPALKPWLASTPVVQAAEPAIRAKALELRKGAPDIETFARRVIDFTSKNPGTGKAFVALDASSAMGCGGSCTSRANLGAALLRAGGVPARTVSHLPIWAYGSPLYEHWLVEYWHPGAGWTRLETTQGEFRPPASSFAALAIASADDERRTGTPGQLGWIMPGAAWMSGIQGTGGLKPAGDDEDGDKNWCRPERRMAVEAVMVAARKAWPRLAMGHPELDGAATTEAPEVFAKRLSGL